MFASKLLISKYVSAKLHSSDRGNIMGNIYAIGIDIGGGTMKCALVDLNGKITGDKIITSTDNISQEAIAKDIINVIKTLESRISSDDKILWVGLCSPGTVNNKTGIIEYGGPNLPFKNFDVRQLVKEETGYCVETVNDGYATARGEYKFGAAKEFKKSVIIAPGTGTAVTLVDNGTIKGTELGHMTMVMDGEPCNCTGKGNTPKYGCAEQYTSTTALVRMTREAMNANPNSMMWAHCGNDISAVDGKTPFHCAAQGDETAKQVIDLWTKCVGHLAVSAANAYDNVEGIVLAGTVSKQGARLSQPVQSIVNKNTYGGAPLLVKHAQFPGDSALVGAAAGDAEKIVNR
jgi:glucokinase